MTKKQRQAIFEKYGGKCAYSGKPLDDKWQVDHVTPKRHWKWQQPDCKDSLNHIDNLVPALRIINHYKRGQDLELFRDFIMRLHIRLKKLPKKTIVERSEKRKKYLLEVAEHMGISADKPFNGQFYFETFKQHTDKSDI